MVKHRTCRIAGLALRLREETAGIA